MKNICSDIAITIGTAIGVGIGLKAMDYINKVGYIIRVNDTIKMMDKEYGKKESK